MVSYSLKRKKSKDNKKKYLNIFIFFIIFSVVLIILSDYLGFAYGFFNPVISPIKAFSSTISLGVTGFFNGIGNISNLEKQNVSLTRQLKADQSKIVTMQRYYEENTYLKKQLNNKYLVNKYNYIESQILYYGPTGTFGYIYVSVDSKSIKIGDSVVYENYLIGKITNIYGNYAKVMLISNVNMQVPVYIKNYNAILTGSLSNSLILNDVTQFDKISVGDIVLTSGLGSSFPKNLIVGYISYISPNSSSSIRSVDVNNAINVNNLKYVFVLINKSQ
ncbi:rod shape-determining protein MreC [Patescibacteria group bacterium]|nr:rod shape-determining protein MreC [Patescibacteria group bacterium]